MQMSDHYPALEGNLAALSLGYGPKHRQQNQAHPVQQPMLLTEDLGLPDSWFEDKEPKSTPGPRSVKESVIRSVDGSAQSRNGSPRSAQNSPGSETGSPRPVFGPAEEPHGIPGPFFGPVEEPSGTPRQVLDPAEEPSGTPRPVFGPAGKPSSGLRSLDHSCKKCEACKTKSLKTVLNQLSRTEQSSFNELKEAKNRNMQTISTQMYKPRAHVPNVNDKFLNHESSFQTLKRRDKGHFTIHPNFVSESADGARRLRARHVLQ